jgi:hypothetical protein
MDIKMIKQREDYGRAMARLSALMDLDPQPGSEQDDDWFLSLCTPVLQRKD